MYARACFCRRVSLWILCGAVASVNWVDPRTGLSIMGYQTIHLRPSRGVVVELIGPWSPTDCSCSYIIVRVFCRCVAEYCVVQLNRLTGWTTILGSVLWLVESSIYDPSRRSENLSGRPHPSFTPIRGLPVVIRAPLTLLIAVCRVPGVLATTFPLTNDLNTHHHWKRRHQRRHGLNLDTVL
jgi:hypothetical protein